MIAGEGCPPQRNARRRTPPTPERAQAKAS
jgi:hypothetical protein